MQKKYKNITLEKNDSISIEYGAVDRKKPEIIYVNYKTYLSSNKENDGYNSIMTCVLRSLKRHVSTYVSNSRFEKNFIFDYDILQGIQSNFKNKILTFELYLKQPKDDIKPLRALQQEIGSMSESFLANLSENLKKNNIELSKVKIS